MEESEAAEEIPTIEDLKNVKPEKKQRSAEQLLVLAKAREKALEVRRQNKALRDKEKEVKAAEKRQARQKIEAD